MVDSSAVPLDVSLLTDVSGSMNPDDLARYWKSILPAEALLRPDDLVGLTTFGEYAHEQWAPAAPPVPPGPVPPRQTESTRLFDALAQVSLRRASPGRLHVVVVFTDGGEYRSVTSLPELAAVLARSDALIYWMLASGRKSPVLDQLATFERGDVFKTTDLQDGLRRVLASVAKRYVLVFQPKDVPASGWHQLEVTITRPGTFSVRARQWYVVGRD